MRSVIGILAIFGGGLLCWAAFTGVSLPWYGHADLTQAAQGVIKVAPPLHWNGFQSGSSA